MKVLNRTNNKGWKELIPIVKKNSSELKIDNEFKSINQTPKNERFTQDLTSQYFSNNIPALNTIIYYRTCNNCGRPIAYSGLIDHLHKCCSNKDKASSTTAIDANIQEMSLNKAKKAKRSDSVEADLSPSKKQLKSVTPGTKKQRTVKQRNPTEPHLVDLDKQCGVELPERGVCGRSLTCKSHSMGAKRAVQGRSKSFDILLTEYQKKNHIKNSNRCTKSNIQQPNQKQQLQKQKQQGSGQELNVPILSPEEETTQVLNGISRSFPLPLQTTVLKSTKTRTKYFRMREMLASSFSVRPGYSSPGYGAIHSRVGCIDLDRTTDYTFRIRVPQLINQVSMQNSLSHQFQPVQPLRHKHQIRPQQAQPLPTVQGVSGQKQHHVSQHSQSSIHQGSNNLLSQPRSQQQPLFKQV